MVTLFERIAKRLGLDAGGVPRSATRGSGGGTTTFGGIPVPGGSGTRDPWGVFRRRKSPLPPPTTIGGPKPPLSDDGKRSPLPPPTPIGGPKGRLSFSRRAR